jgi:hypothetical protein
MNLSTHFLCAPVSGYFGGSIGFVLGESLVYLDGRVTDGAGLPIAVWERLPITVLLRPWARGSLQFMTADIRKLVHAVPFVPFTIHLADGGQLRVPSIDHIAVPPAGGRIFVFGDDERYDVVSSLLISRVTVDREPTSAAQK